MLAAADGDARGINVFLYQVAANAAWAGNALPTRRDDGSLLNRPEQALDLHYLLTFSGDENALEPQRMLGAAVTALVAEPVLGRQRLRDIIAAAVADDPATWQQFSDLPDQVELVRFTPLPLSLEEHLQALVDTSSRRRTGSRSPTRPRWCCSTRTCTVQPALPVLTRGVDAAALTIPVVTPGGRGLRPGRPDRARHDDPDRGAAAARHLRHPGPAGRRGGPGPGGWCHRDPADAVAARGHPGRAAQPAGAASAPGRHAAGGAGRGRVRRRPAAGPPA